MAIFGVGSNWNGEEKRDRFFDERKFIVGWDVDSARDLYAFLASLKVGDVLYIKANQPGARVISVKGVGIVEKSVMDCLTSGEFEGSCIPDGSRLFVRVNRNSLFVRVRWVDREEFTVTIPENEGRLTNIRAATIYEEYLPFVQDAILRRITTV
ncbi:MAG: hypothetical protein WCD04_08125 [Terriglobia bacterium]|jgi:hypothetical protein